MNSCIRHCCGPHTVYVGIPEDIVSENGPQFSAELYASFAREYGFDHVTSSPHYPQGNGKAETAVKTLLTY